MTREGDTLNSMSEKKGGFTSEIIVIIYLTFDGYPCNR